MRTVKSETYFLKLNNTKNYSTLNMGVAAFTRIFLRIYKTTRHVLPEASNLHRHTGIHSSSSTLWWIRIEKRRKKLAALSMLHKAKKAYYAVIAWLRVRVARYTHPVYSPSGSCHSDVTSLPPLFRYPLSIAWLRVRVARYTFLFSLAWPWRIKSLVKHNMLIHTQTAQAHSPITAYPTAAVFFLCTCFSLLYS